MPHPIHDLCQQYIKGNIAKEEFWLHFVVECIKLDDKKTEEFARAIRDLYLTDGEG